MFTPEAIIDSVQHAKKQFVNTVVTNDSFKKELNKLIDSQTEFAKGSYKSSLAILEALIKNTTDTFYAKSSK